ncbi:MAG: hypothetical protein ACI4U3_10655, partial [Traorella sp.]
GHYYTILVVAKGQEIYTEEDYIFGKYLNSHVFYDYLNFRKSQIEKIILQLNDEKQIHKFKKLLAMIQQKIDEA